MARRRDRPRDRAGPSRVLKRRLERVDGRLDREPERLLFIDKTWTATTMTRSHGRCPKGARLRMGLPHGHRNKTALVAGLCMTEMIAPMVLDWPTNRDWFEAYGRSVLVPGPPRGEVVLMDNLSGHKRASVREQIEAAGHNGIPFLNESRPQATLEAMAKGCRERIGSELIDSSRR